ncbi:uncharacterized protein LOC135368730 isoform X2 [Ornithodoros turicata]|uniref:uncharacterized protein LOC135368730 isoform X2 n=1 Tax=Ornithodoros turicata TaxID=34597 RepID=UPI003139EAF5
MLFELDESRMDDPGGGGGDSSPQRLWNADAGHIAVPGPIFFLIREQAKSLLAIKELQERVQALEGFRNDIFFAIHDIQKSMHHPVKPASHGTSPLVQSSQSSVNAGSSSSCHTSKISPKTSWAKSQRLTGTNSSRIRTKPTVVISKAESPTKRPASLSSQVTAIKGDASTTLESDKQDSGLDSDCRDHASGVPNNSIAAEDELLLLLDEIGERGLKLREKVQEMEKGHNTYSDTGFSHNHSCPNQSSMLEFHSKELQARLSQMEIERTNYRATVQKLQSVIHRLEGEKTACEDRLQSAVNEKQQLEKKIYGLHMQYVHGEPGSLPLSKGESWTGESPQDPPSLQEKNARKGMRSEEGKAKVSAILRENNPLELQRLLLFYTLENQSLQQKIEESDQKWFAKLCDWKTTESSLRADIQNLIQEREECLESLQKHQEEVRALRAKYRVLEMTVLTINNRDCGDSVCERTARVPAWVHTANQRLARSYHCDSDTYGEAYYRAQSLPPVLVAQAENAHTMFKQNMATLHNAGSSLTENSLEDTTFQNEGMAYDLEDPRFQRPLRFTSSPQSSPQKLYRPLWQNPATVRRFTRDPVHLMNLEDSGKDLESGPKSDIELICSEFDPLVKVEDSAVIDTGKKMRPLDFVDSLDLSIPLKPTKVPTGDIEDPQVFGGLGSRYLEAHNVPVEAVQRSRRFSNILQKSRTLSESST